MTVSTKAKAWEAVDRLFPSDYTLDSEMSRRAGYPIYSGIAGWICDLNTRLEVNLFEGNKSINVRVWAYMA